MVALHVELNFYLTLLTFFPHHGLNQIAHHSGVHLEHLE
jgi:hypothetical protein